MGQLMDGSTSRQASLKADGGEEYLIEMTTSYLAVVDNNSNHIGGCSLQKQPEDNWLEIVLIATITVVAPNNSSNYK